MIAVRVAVAVVLLGVSACADKPRARLEASRIGDSSIQISPVATAISSTVTSGDSPRSRHEPNPPACSAVDPSVASDSPRQRTNVHVALVDSAWAGDEGDIGILLFSVEVQRAGSKDTIPKIRVATLPGVSDSGKVHLIAFKRESNIPDDAEVYDPVARTLTICDLPGEIEFSSQHPSISPDARHVAYIGWESEMTQNLGVVRKWADAAIVVKTPAETFFNDDVDYNGVRWLDSGHAEFAYRSGHTRNVWIHTIVSVDDRKMTVDSLSSQPSWAR